MVSLRKVYLDPPDMQKTWSIRKVDVSSNAQDIVNKESTECRGPIMIKKQMELIQIIKNVSFIILIM